jgi:hypothetical protein
MRSPERKPQVSFAERELGPLIFVVIGLFVLLPLEILRLGIVILLKPIRWFRKKKSE